VVLCYSPDRLARKFAYQALLIEEFARAGTRVEFIKGPRGDSPEDQLLVQFQGMFAEYEKAQIMERYRRGKAHRARTGSVNVLSGAPFGYRYIRKTDHTGAPRSSPHEAALVAELFAATPTAARRSRSDPMAHRSGIATRTGKSRWDRSVIWACCATLPTPGAPSRKPCCQRIPRSTAEPDSGRTHHTPRHQDR
jgi:site-specific DNA recombinase